VLDISLDKNRIALMRALNNGAFVAYYDHHFSGVIPQSKNFEAHIDTSGGICTSLIVNNHLNGKHSMWAAVGAYGDNFFNTAKEVVKEYDFSKKQLNQLKDLGTVLNYNSYGISLSDLHFDPDSLYQSLHKYKDPFSFINEEEKYKILLNGYNSDFEQILSIIPNKLTEKTVVVVLPDTKWSRRVSGVYGNQLARKYPNRAHAILTELPDNGFRVSVRAPLATKKNADTLCRQFKTGGGRAAAAGINRLKYIDYDNFLEQFITMYK
jgi:hypothetical protein